MAKHEKHVDQIWESVQAQPRKLTVTERRRVMTYLNELGQLVLKSNYELARNFAVSEAQIRADKKKMLLSIGESLTADNAMVLIAQHTSDLNALIQHAYIGLNDCAPGGPFHRNYLETLGKLTAQKFTALQEIGIVRKELGHMNVTHEEWEAKISDEMIASVTQKTPEELT